MPNKGLKLGSRLPLAERIASRYEVCPTTGCWLWLGVLNDRGYGQIGIRKQCRRAHRVVYELHRGPIPEGLQIDHLCKTRCCVNPDHLEAVTQYENNMRSESIVARNARKTKCIRGHEITGIKADGSGRRYCKACNKMYGDNSKNKPERIAWMREYSKRPEVRERLNAAARRRCAERKAVGASNG